MTALLALTACGSDNNPGSSSSSAAGSSSAASDCGGKATLNAEGSTAQKNAIDIFSKDWGQACPGKNLNYNGTGSGTGRKQFIAKQADFAGSDSALSADEAKQAAGRCGGNPALNLPLVFGPIAMVYNLSGVDKLTLNAETLAKIFSGAITTWNDPAIAALNSGITLPATKISPIYRSDSSGTTDNFQKYLTAAAPQAWNKGTGSDFKGGAGESKLKSAGVVQGVQATDGAIGYVEVSPAKAANLPFAQIDSGSGAVSPADNAAIAATTKLLSSVKFTGQGNDLAMDLTPIYASKDAGAYPLLLATYEIVCSKGYEPDTAAAVKSFLTVASNQGQQNLLSAGFIPLPDSIKQKLTTSISAIA